MADFFTPSGAPAYRSGPTGTSAAMRAEFTAIQTAMAKLAGYTGNGGKTVRIDDAGTAYGVSKLTITEPATSATLTIPDGVTFTGPSASGTAATLAGAETLSNKTFTAPALGTPASGVLTNCIGTAAGLTAGNVTTNANLTGGVTSVGNAATVVTNANLTGGVTSVGNAATVVTNANLTGDVTSIGNAATVVKINGTSLATLGTGILKNTTTTGVPSIAVAGDFPTLNQNTTGSAASVTTTATVTGAITSSSATAGIGYAAGAGSSNSVALAGGTVTMNTVTGSLQLNSGSMVDGTVYNYQLNNTTVGQYDHVIVTLGINGPYVKYMRYSVAGNVIYIAITGGYTGVVPNIAVNFGVYSGVIS